MPTVYARRFNLKDSLTDSEVAAFWKYAVEEFLPACLKANGLRMYYTKSPTVNYVGNYEIFYRLVGRTPPADAKATIDFGPIFDWIMSLNEHERRLASRRCGIDLMVWARSVSDRS